MKDQKKTKEQLISELAELRQRIAELETVEAERERTQEDLIRLSSAVEATTDAITMIDLEGKVLSVNQAAVRAYGIDNKSHFVGRSTFDFVAPEDREKALAAMQQVLEKGYVGEREFHLIHIDGLRIPVAASGALIKDVDGKPIGVVAVLRDITERKRAEEALQESERKFRGLTEQSPNMIFINHRGRVVYANKKCEEMMGYTTEEFCSPDFDFLILITPESQEPVKESFSRHMRGEEVPPHEYTLLTKDGKRIEALLATNLLQYGGETAILGTVTDITERKQAEEELRNSEHKYRTLVGNLPQRIFLKDRNSVYVSCNANFARDLKIHPDEITGKTDYDLFPKQIAEKYMVDDRRIMESGRTEEVEETYVVNGQGQSVHVLKTPVKDEHDNIVGVLGIFRDVTERKRMEEQMRVKDSAMASSINAIAIADLEGNVTYVNGSFTRLWGYDKEELLGKHYMQLVHNGEQVEAVIEAVLKKGSWQGELVATRKDGSTFNVQLSASMVRDEAGDPINMMCSAIDVSDRKQMEQQLKDYSENLERMVEERTRELQDAEERYRSTFEYAGDAILVHDMDYVIQGFNRRAEEMFGYKAEEVVGRQTYDIVHPTTPAEKHEADQVTAHLVAQAIKQGFYRDQEVTSYMRKDRKPFPAEASGAMIRDSQEKVIGFVSIYRDISQRKRLEKEKEQYARKLEAKIEEVERTKSELQEAQEKLVRTEKLAAIGELAGGVGHELRNPLGAIKNTAYLLNMILTEPDPQVKEALAILDKEVTKSDRIIADLLDFSRPGKASIVTVDINRIVQEVVRDTTLPQNVEMSTTLQRNLPPALADADQLQRVLSNLVTNALQAMPDGGKLTLTTRGKDSLVEMAVTDTGVGIPEENLDKVFEPLFTTKAKGVGLGLALSRALVERQRGTLEVESEVGKGSTFTLTLPIGGKEERQDAGESLHPDCG